MKQSGIIYYYSWDYRPGLGSPAPVRPVATSPVPESTTPTAPVTHPHSARWTNLIGLGLIALALGGLTGPLTPRIRLETRYAMLQVERAWPGIQTRLLTSLDARKRSFLRYIATSTAPAQVPAAPQAQTVPAAFDPLKQPDGSVITPASQEFSLVIPKIGINSTVIPSVNPTKPGEYLEALKKGIAHSSLSYFPDEDGSVYLFSHSTNYEWFVGDLNAVFYLLKNLDEGDTVILVYKGTTYTYKITGKQVVKPTAINYLVPQAGAKRLILQTCWPPGSTTERLLIFADLIDTASLSI